MTLPLFVRPSNASLLLACCTLALAFTHVQAQSLRTQLVVRGLVRPVYVTNAPGDSTRLFVVEQRDGSTAAQATPTSLTLPRH